MDFDVTRAVDYIITGQFESDKLNPQSSSTSSSLSAKGMLNSVRQIFPRSKSPLKNRKSSNSSAPTEVINVNEDDLEDAQLRLAVEMSLHDSGSSSRRQSPAPPLPPNKPGSNSPYFGPARASDYHEGSWGMVVSGSSGQETGIVDSQGNTWTTTTVYELDNVEPVERKRVEGQPVVLDTRGTSGAWNLDAVTALAGLMTILHNIPKVREALLLASPRDPGQEDEPGEKWWKGNQPMFNPASSEEELDITGETVLRETARIIAFLDDTERSYGRFFPISISLTIRLSQYLVTALRNDISKFPKRGNSKETEVTQAMFLERWSYIVNSIPQRRTYVTSPLQCLFVSQIYQPPTFPSKSDEFSEYLCEIYISIPRELSDAGTHTILDALETVIWWGDRPACLKSFSDILLIRLKRDDREDGAGVELLPKFSMSRFASDNYEKTEEQIRLRRGIEETLVKLRKTEESLSWIEKGGKKYRATQILEAAIQYVESLEGKKMFEEEVDVDENSTRMDIDSDTNNLPAITEQMKSALETLNERIQGIPLLLFDY